MRWAWTVTSGRVRPVRYKNAQLRQTVGRYLGRADSDDIMAATLWAAEAVACRHAVDDLASHAHDLSVAVEYYEQRLLQGLPPSIQREAGSAISQLLTGLRHELGVVKAAHAKAEEAFEKLRLDFGTNPLELFMAPRSDSAADTIHDLLDEADEALWRANDHLSAYSAEVEKCNALAIRRNSFAKTDTSVSTEHLARLDGSSLEALIARLLERDGVTVLRPAGGPGDQGVDVLGRLPTKEIVAIQSKYRQRGSVSPRVVYELNGAARDLHGASFAVVVTNSTFSEQARRDAATLGVRLVDGHGLAAWATWGDTLFDVTGISEAPTAGVPERAA